MNWTTRFTRFCRENVYVLSQKMPGVLIWSRHKRIWFLSHGFRICPDSLSVNLLRMLAWPVQMVYWSSYETMLNSSSEVQWTVMVSWDAVHSSSRMVGAFGAVTKQIFQKHVSDGQWCGRLKASLSICRTQTQAHYFSAHTFQNTVTQSRAGSVVGKTHV